MIKIRIQYFPVIAVLLCSSFLMGCVRSEEALNSEAESYLKDNSDRNADVRWESDFHRAAEQAMRDNASITDEERYAADKALDFFFDQKKHFEESSQAFRVKDKIEIARWYLLFFKNGWHFPSRIAAQLTKSNFERYVASK